MAAAAGGAAAFTVTTQSTRDEIGIQTLVGDYKETGTNHGKKVYQKLQKIAGHEDINVFLYYWDQRDGADFSGWWFGDQVGGSEVWARAVFHGPTPPRVGWRIPWDSPKAEPGMLFVDPVGGAGAAAPGAAAGGRPTLVPGGAASAGVPLNPGQAQVRVKAAVDKLTALEAAIQQAVTSAKALNATSDAQMVLDTQQELNTQHAAMMEFQKSLTMDINDVRKGGPAVMASATELTKLSPRLRQLQTLLSPELQKIKSIASKAQATAASAKSEADAKAAEERDGKEFEESLPSFQAMVGKSEEGVEAVASLAEPLLADPPEDATETLKQALEEVEAAANDAQDKITEARKEITAKLQSARKFAPETRKRALTEFSGLQGRLTEAQKKINPYKTFKKDFGNRVAARKQLMELAEKLAAAELEVEKATMMSSAAEHGQMSEDELTSVEKVVKPAKTAIEDALRVIEQKAKVAGGAMKDELGSMRDKASGFKKAVDAVSLTLKRQRESLSTREMLQTAAQKVEAAEDAIKACQDAEMPYLKGVEVLPGDESDKALKDCEAAAAKGDAALKQAGVFLRAKLAEAKGYVKELAASVTEELTAYSGRLEQVTKRLAQFKKDTTERKMTTLMAEVVDAVTSTEKKVDVATKAAEVFSSENLDAVSADTLKEAIEKTNAAEKEAASAMLEARKLYAAKQKEVKGPDANAAMSKLQGRINEAQTGLSKAKKAAAMGEKLIKGKEVLGEEDKKVAEVEEQVKQAEGKVKPNEEQAAMGVEATKLSDEEIEAMTSMLLAAQKTLKASSRTIEANSVGAVPTLKTLLQKLSERCKAALTTISEIMSMTKDQRERVMSDVFVREGTAKCDEVEAAMDKVSEVELPFLKGLEVLPLQEATDATKASEEAAANVQTAISAARTFISAKNLEVKQYGEAAAKPAMEEFAAQTERINAAASKLAQFRKETESRKKTALMQEAGEKMNTVEEEVKKLADAVEPFLKEGEKDESEEATDKLVAQAKAAQAAIDDTRKFLSARQKDAQGNAAHGETLAALNKRMTEAQASWVKHKKVATPYEAKFLGKRVLGEANALLEEVEKEVEKAAKAAAPLVDEAGERFLVGASARTLAQAWRDHMKDKGLTIEALFKEVGGGSGGIGKDAFVSLLERLPGALGREEIAFSEARRQAIFDHADADGDGKISQDEFKALFKQRFTCVKEITVTDGFDVSQSKNVAKLEGGAALETFNGPQKEESTGMMRIECTVVGSGQVGFVTMQGNQGTQFIELVSPFTTFCSELDKTLSQCQQAVQGKSAMFADKARELAAAGKDPALATAATELQKVKTQYTAACTSLQKLKAKVAESKTEYGKKEKKEANAHIEAKERKAAEALLAPAIAKMEETEASLAKLEEATKTMVALSKDELEAFGKPLSTSEEAEKLCQTVIKLADEAKEAITAQTGELPKAPQGPMLEAKRDMLKMSAKAEGLKKKSKGIVDAVRAKCGLITEKTGEQVASAMRSHMQSQSLSIEKYFAELAKSSDKISHAEFSKHIQGLLGEKFNAEHVGLLCKHIEADGIGRRRFQSMLQQYFVVVKGIAITDSFGISEAKTIRKAELDEVIELLEGPRSDEKMGITRIRGKSLVDGLEGWISLHGNQGTPFLTEVEKPCYCCKAEITLDREFKCEGESGAIRQLKADEVLELLEGPKKLTTEPAVRVKGKAISDGALGWFTARDKNGTIFAEADSKYYSCTSSVAMTDEADIKDCKVLRKLGVGELFTVEEGPVDEASGVTRVKGKCLKDELIGWVTIKGNAGTKYAEASNKHFCVLKDVPLTKLFPTAKPGEEVRKLAKGEAMQVLEGPKEETTAPEVRVKVKAISDGAVGWLTLANNNTSPWTPFYTCKVKSPMHKGLAVEGAEVVREVAVGETLELLEGPTEDGKVLRIKAKADKDGEVGWLTVRDAEGKRYFES